MSKSRLTSGYTFNPASRQLDMSGVPNFKIEGLLLVENVAAQVTVYAVEDVTAGYTSVNNGVVTLKCDTRAMSSTDPLLVIYDDGVGTFNLATNTELQKVTAGVGNVADSPPTGDTGNSSLIGLMKRLLSSNTANLGLSTDSPTATDTTSGSLIARFARLLQTQSSANALLTAVSSKLSATLQVQLAQMLPSGSNLVGKVGIDQTTPGSTNGVVLADTRGTATVDVTTAGTYVDLQVPNGASILGYVVTGMTGSSAITIQRSNDGSSFQNTTGYSGPAVGRTNANLNNASGALQGYVHVAGARVIRFVTLTTGTGAANIVYNFSSGQAPSGGVNATSGVGGMTGPVRLVSSMANTNPVLVKVGSSRLYKITGFNASSSVKWLHLYDTAASPVAGSTTVLFSLPLPVGAYNHDMSNIGYSFALGVAFTITGGPADNDTTALAAGDILNHTTWVQ